MTKPWTVESLLAETGRQMRRQAVAELLAGNDTCCFTIWQYQDRYLKISKFNDSLGYRICTLDVCRMHLESVGCVEVRPDVWTRKEIAGDAQ